MGKRRITTDRVVDNAGGIKIVASEKGSNESEKGPGGRHGTRSKERKKERRKVKAHPYAATQKLSKCKIDGATPRVRQSSYIRAHPRPRAGDSLRFFLVLSLSFFFTTAIALKLRALPERRR